MPTYTTPRWSTVTAPMACGKSLGQACVSVAPPSSLFHTPAVATATKTLPGWVGSGAMSVTRPPTLDGPASCHLGPSASGSSLAVSALTARAWSVAFFSSVPASGALGPVRESRKKSLPVSSSASSFSSLSLLSRVASRSSPLAVSPTASRASRSLSGPRAETAKVDSPATVTSAITIRSIRLLRSFMVPSPKRSAPPRWHRKGRRIGPSTT